MLPLQFPQWIVPKFKINEGQDSFNIYTAQPITFFFIAFCSLISSDHFYPRLYVFYFQFQIKYSYIIINLRLNLSAAFRGEYFENIKNYVIS